MFDNQFCIVRGTDSGLFFGRVASVDGRIAELREARCLWWWEGANDPTQLAREGTERPDFCQFTCVVDMLAIYDLIEIIPCTEEAVKSIQGVPEWKK